MTMIRQAWRWLLDAVFGKPAARRPRVLFVCAGNTCRSPMAAALASVLHPHVDYESAGVAARPGAAASATAILLLHQKYNVDLSRHRARSAQLLDPTQYDAVYAMDDTVARQLRQIWGLAVPSLRISDPFGGSMDRYRYAAASIITALYSLPTPTVQQR